MILSNSGHKGSGKRPRLSSEEKKQAGEDGEERRRHDLPMPMEGLNWRAEGGYRDPMSDQTLRRKSLTG